MRSGRERRGREREGGGEQRDERGERVGSEAGRVTAAVRSSHLERAGRHGLGVASGSETGTGRGCYLWGGKLRPGGDAFLPSTWLAVAEVSWL